MTVQRSWGPLVVIGRNPAIGSATGAGPGVAAPPPYVSGTNEDPDSGPSVFGFGVALRDIRTMSRPDGIGLVAGGYANQDYAYISNSILASDFAPATATNNNLSAAAAPHGGVAATLSPGPGVTRLSAPFTVPGTLNVIPSGALQIDAAPSWVSYGTSGAVEGWAGAALGRGVVLNASASMSNVVYTIRGFDLFGYAQSETLTGPASGTTVNSKKAYKWILSITPSATNASTGSFGTIDVFEFPLMARRFFQTNITWNNATLTSANIASAGATLSTTAGTWQPADTTSPATQATGTMRGAITVPSASDGTKRLQIIQTILPADLANAATTWGVTPA